MPNFNKVVLCGRMGSDPETRFLPSKVQVTSFSIAINEQWKDQSGNKQERTSWVDCESFAKTAEIIAQYFKKGSHILIDGKLRQDVWDDKNGGGKRSKLKVVIENFQFIDSKGGKPADSSDSQPSLPQASPPPEPATAGVADPDIPFHHQPWIPA